MACERFGKILCQLGNSNLVWEWFKLQPILTSVELFLIIDPRETRP